MSGAKSTWMDARIPPDRSPDAVPVIRWGAGKATPLVIDTVGYNERTWLGFNGYLHSDELRTLERITRPKHTRCAATVRS
ncbi:MAG: hypothetical protein IPM70_14185 [Proteobacteria bacterium]|nr:hypothetical protein [Pseudomonadota bacterium]